MPLADPCPSVDQAVGTVVGNQRGQFEPCRLKEGGTELIGLITKSAGKFKFCQPARPLPIGNIVSPGEEEGCFPHGEHALVHGVHRESTAMTIERGTVGDRLLQVESCPDQAPSAIHEKSCRLDQRQGGRIDGRHAVKSIRRPVQDPVARLQLVGEYGVKWRSFENAPLDDADVDEIDVETARQFNGERRNHGLVDVSVDEYGEVIIIEGAPAITWNGQNSALTPSKAADKKDGAPLGQGNSSLDRLDDVVKIGSHARFRRGRGQGGEGLRQGSPLVGA